MTPQQEKQLRIQAGQRGYTREKVEAFVQFAKSKEQATATVTPAAPQKKSIIKDTIADVVKPVVRAGTSLFNIGAGVIEGAKTFAKEGAGGDYSKAIQETQKERVLPLAGPTKPLTNITQGFGAGAEIGSYFVGAGQAKGLVSIGKSVFAQAVLNGAKTGAAVGALNTAGRSAEEDGSVLDIAESAVKGAAVGAAAGGVFSGGANVVGKVASKTANTVQGARQALTTDDSLIGRTTRRIQDAFKKREAMKAQPPLIQKAAKLEISPETSHFIVDSSPADRASYRVMLDLAEKAKNTLRPTNRPVEIPGRTIIERVKHLNTVRKTTGKELGAVARNMPATKFTPTTAHQELAKGFEELGVTMTNGGKLNFTKSSITGPEERRLLQRIALDLRFGRSAAGVTGNMSHKIRQRIFNMLDLGKQQGNLTSYSEVVANKVREALKQDIVNNTGAAGEKYARLSKQYASTHGALDDFYKLIGKKWSGKSEELLSLRAGEVGNRILGNASANPLDIITRLEDTARAHGFRGKNNPIDQLIFNDLIEDLVGSTQTRSLRGQIGRGVSDAVQDAVGIAKDAATGNAPGVATRMWDFATKVSPDEQRRVLRELLR